LEGDHIHEVEGVGDVVELLVTESDKQVVGDKLDVLAHQGGVHADERDGECVGEELLLDDDGFGDDAADGVGVGTLAKVREEEASKVGVHTLITRDELVRERETRHQSALLQPEDRRKRPGEEDALDRGECNQPLSECRASVRDPSQGPVRLALDAWDCLDGIEQELALRLVLDIRVDEERVCLGVYVLHHNLETYWAGGQTGGDVTTGRRVGDKINTYHRTFELLQLELHRKTARRGSR
jgi:hypothetical protein